MRTPFWMILLLLSCMGSAVALAAGSGAVRKQVESSLLVTGTIDIHADGSVAGYSLPAPSNCRTSSWNSSTATF